MMERRCDRCRCPIPDNVPEGSLRIVGLGFTLNDFAGSRCSNEHYRDGDLCEVCARDLLDWLKGGPFASLTAIHPEPPSEPLAEPISPLDAAMGAIIAAIGALADATPAKDRITVHELKILPDFLRPVWNGTKAFEVRTDDRDFKVGDWLDLNEWTEDGGYTGRHVKVRVGYKLPSNLSMGLLSPGACVLGIINPLPGRTCPYCGYPILSTVADGDGRHPCSHCDRDWKEGME